MKNNSSPRVSRRLLCVIIPAVTAILVALIHEGLIVKLIEILH